MRGKRRNRGTWFPILATEAEEAPYGATFFRYSDDITGASGPYSAATATPLVADFTENDTNQAGVSLRDFVEGQSWLCNRVVGQVFAEFGSAAQTTNEIVAAAGLAVLPSDETGAPALENGEFAPFNAANSANPWLWRRTWLLRNPGQTDSALGRVPACNILYGDMRSGPFLDTKGSKRMITREQRLFFITQIATPSLIEPTDDPTVIWTYDLRVFGQMVRTKNRSTFA